VTLTQPTERERSALFSRGCIDERKIKKLTRPAPRLANGGVWLKKSHTSILLSALLLFCSCCFAGWSPRLDGMTVPSALSSELAMRLLSRPALARTASDELLVLLFTVRTKQLP